MFNLDLRSVFELPDDFGNSQWSEVHRYVADGSPLSEEEWIAKESGGLEDGPEFDAWNDPRPEVYSGWWSWDELDSDTNPDFQFVPTRCYDPVMGRWLSAEPAAFEDGKDNQHPYPRTQ